MPERWARRFAGVRAHPPVLRATIPSFPVRPFARPINRPDVYVAAGRRMIRTIMETNSFASGARRSRAAVAVVNSLGAVDLVAAIVAEDAQASVTDAVRRELNAQEYVRVFDLNLDSASGLYEEGLQGGEDSQRHRDIYLCGGVDAAIERDPEGFEHAVEELCSSIAREGHTGWNAHTVRRVVIIGGNALLDRLDHLIHGIQRGVRYRYILVQ